MYNIGIYYIKDNDIVWTLYIYLHMKIKEV